MKTITTTREYDAEGRLVKETVCEVVTTDAPVYPVVITPPSCTCGTSGVCAVHGQRGWWQTQWYCKQAASLTSGSDGSVAMNVVLA